MGDKLSGSSEVMKTIAEIYKEHKYKNRQEEQLGDLAIRKAEAEARKFEAEAGEAELAAADRYMAFLIDKGMPAEEAKRYVLDKILRPVNATRTVSSSEGQNKDFFLDK